MINRVLIRIKVVQMLYSYLLTRSDFKMPTLPESASRDKVFAFTLYHDLLLFLLKMGGYRSSGQVFETNRIFRDNRFLKALAAAPETQTRLGQSLDGFSVIEPLLPEIYSDATNTHAYRSYIRLKSRELADDVNLLLAVVDSVIKKAPSFYDASRKISGFTNAGYELAFDMVCDTLRSFCDNRTWYADAKNSLHRSLDKAYELYHALLLLVVELTDMQEQRVDAQKHKHLPTAEDLNPNMKFVNNMLAAMIRESDAMSSYLKENPISWTDANPGLVRRLLDKIIESDIYKEYMDDEHTDLKGDCDFWKNVFKKIIFPSDDLAESLESMSVYWNDDLNIMDSFVIKTIKRAATDGSLKLLPKYKDDEDARFGADLFDKAVLHREEYKDLIDSFVNQKQWDTERLAFMDIVVMIAAITELLEYPAIPIPVTLNEYIEIANCYSTPKSGQFVNGILYSVINHLKETGRLSKN